jgi:soluble lytic murein transglycosylase-like protein
MPSYAWSTTPDGCVYVDRDAGGLLDAPDLQLISIDPATYGIAREVQATWGALASDAGARHGAPVSWILATILWESGGDPDAINPTSGAVGLMQIMPGIHGLTAAELSSPVINVNKGAELLGDSKRLGFDLPQAVSRFNAGAVASGKPHLSASSPWGYREDPGHIEKVVRAHNYYADCSSGPGRAAVGLGAGALALLVVGAVFLAIKVAD